MVLVQSAYDIPDRNRSEANGHGEAAFEISTDVLVVGAGPAGGALATFLSYHGVKGLMISRDYSTATQPRAHFTNAAAFECVRDIGLEQDFRKVSLHKDHYGYMRFCNSLAGKDFLRAYSWCQYPARLGDYETVSPCTHGDVSQNVAEPIFVKYAGQHGFPTRFDSKFLDYQVDPTTGLITSTILDQISQQKFRVISKYLCGADGANSLVGRKAGLPYHVGPTGGMALNVWYEADLSHLYRLNPGLIHVTATPEIDPPLWGIFGTNRIVRDYDEHVMLMAGGADLDKIEINPDAVLKRLRELIGDEKVEIKVKGIYKWRINDSYAQKLSSGNVFCLGDAIHRHPPGNGLGSNTCIQDAYNLAWKIAYVIKGLAGPGLLDTYDAERQPIAQRIVRVANDTMRYHRGVQEHLGLGIPDVKSRLAMLKLIEEDSAAGRQKRKDLREAYALMEDECAGLGAEMNQKYQSTAINTESETDAGPTWKDGSEGVRHHVISTYPGSRLPHAWLGNDNPGEKISTHDLAGHGQFTIFTGIGGGAWNEAAKAVSEKLPGVHIYGVSIGPGQDYSDIFYMWEDRRGVDECGAVLVRPDRTVAWRSQGLGTEPHTEKLLTIMKQILHL